MKYLFILILLLSCSDENFNQDKVKKKNPSVEYMKYSISLDKLVDSLKLNRKHAKIKISKLNYLLSIVIDNKIIKTYPIVFGKNPIKDKLCEGDRCTPEGSFKIISKYPHKSWLYFILLDYPNEESKRKFEQAKKNRLISQNSNIGGSIGIHGVPIGTDYIINQRQNWTYGCISMKNKDIIEIYKFVEVGMIVEIEK